MNLAAIIMIATWAIFLTVYGIYRHVSGIHRILARFDSQSAEQEADGFLSGLKTNEHVERDMPAVPEGGSRELPGGVRLRNGRSWSSWEDTRAPARETDRGETPETEG